MSGTSLKAHGLNHLLLPIPVKQRFFSREIDETSEMVQYHSKLSNAKNFASFERYGYGNEDKNTSAAYKL